MPPDAPGLKKEWVLTKEYFALLIFNESRLPANPTLLTVNQMVRELESFEDKNSNFFLDVYLILIYS